MLTPIYRPLLPILPSTSEQSVFVPVAFFPLPGCKKTLRFILSALPFFSAEEEAKRTHFTSALHGTNPDHEPEISSSAPSINLISGF